MERIQLACHADAWDSDDWIPSLDAAANAGYYGVEGFDKLYREYSDRVESGKLILTQRNLQLTALSARGDLVIPDKRGEIIEECLRIAEFLQCLGARHLVLETGSRTIIENIRRDFREAAETLNELGKRCKDFNVNLSIQPRVGDRIEQEEEIDRILNEVDDREVFFCPDTGRLVRAEMNPVEILKIYGSCIKHIHMSDIPMPAMQDSPEADHRTYCPPGQGIVKFEGIVDALHSIRYTGCAVVRFDPGGDDPNQEIIQAKHYLEKLINGRKET